MMDILVKYGDRKVAIEYDGFYWHSPAAKADVDRRKSLDLLAAGRTVVRLREGDLPGLGIDDEQLPQDPGLLQSIAPGAQAGNMPTHLTLCAPT